MIGMPRRDELIRGIKQPLILGPHMPAQNVPESPGLFKEQANGMSLAGCSLIKIGSHQGNPLTPGLVFVHESVDGPLVLGKAVRLDQASEQALFLLGPMAPNKILGEKLDEGLELIL